MEYYIDAFRNYVNFNGRATRTQFWMFVLFNFIANVILMIVGFILPFLAFLGTVYSLAVLLPSWAVGARRLHDTDRSGWWQLIGLVPLVGWIVLLIFFVQPSTGPNRFDCCCNCCEAEAADEQQGE